MASGVVPGIGPEIAKRIVKIFGDRMKAIQLCVNRFDDETKESFLDLFTKIDAGADIEELTADETEENTEEFDV